MVYVVGLATSCKKVFGGWASGIGVRGLDARRSLFVARRAIATNFEHFPSSRNALRKHVVVAIPSAIGALCRIGQIRRIIFRRVRFIASDGDEHDCHERQPVIFVMFHHAIPLLKSE